MDHNDLNKSAANKKVMFVVNDSWFFVSHRLPLAIAARSAGFDVVLTAREDETVVQVRSEGIGFIPWKLSPRNTRIVTEAKAFVSLYKTIKKERPHLLHLVTIKGVLYGGIIARLLKIESVVFAISGMGTVYSSAGLKRKLHRIVSLLLYKLVLNHPNYKVIVQNKEDKNVFRNNWNVPEKNIVTSPGSGVDLGVYKFTDIPKGVANILLASRMLWPKGIETFVEAARTLTAKYENVRFLLAGVSDADNVDSVPEKTLKQWTEEGSVEWVGHQEDMVSLLSESTIVVLPTKYGEGVPKVLIEACSVGRPVIATDWPGCREIVRDGVNGLLVTPGDAKKLAESLEILLNDREYLERLGVNGRSIVEKEFSIDEVTKLTLETYRQLLNKNH